jgi:cyclase
VQKIAENVYVETGFRGCNVSFVVTKNGVVMIDTPQIPAEAEKWRDEIARFGPVRYIINNEPHTDHISGNYFFDGTLISHEGSRLAMQKMSTAMVGEMLKRIAPDNLPLPEGYHVRIPDITLSHNMTLYLGEHTFRLMLMPGHTPFQLATYVPEERVVFTSDNVVNGGLPFLHQAVPFTWLESLKQIEKLEVDTIIPGHGSLCDKSYLPQMSRIIQTWINMVQGAIEKGWTSEEAQDNLHIQDYFPGTVDDEFMKPIRRMMIAHMYDELKKL